MDRGFKVKREWTIGLMAVVVIAVTPWFAGTYALHLLQTYFYMLIAVAGLNILVGASGQLSLGHAGFYAIGAYTSGLLAVKAGLSVWLGMLVGVMFAGMMGLLVALLALRVRGPYLAMVTIAFGMIVEILANRWVSLTGGPMGTYGVPQPSFFGTPLGPTGYFYLCAGLALAVLLLGRNLLRSNVGRRLSAVRQSEAGATSLGINVYATKVLAFAISAALAGLAGGLFAHQNGYLNSDDFTLLRSVTLLMAVIVGGAGTNLGPVVGTAVAIMLPNLLSKLYDYHLAIFGGLLLLAVIALPDGIVGTIEKRWMEKRRAKGDVPLGNVTPEAFNPAPPVSESVLTVKDVAMHFGGVKALESITLSIPGGHHTFGLIGPNGSGKSTLVNVISGFYAATRGEIRLGATSLTGLPAYRRARLGLTRTFQNLQLFEELSCLENVMAGLDCSYRTGFFAAVLRTPGAEREERKMAARALGFLLLLGLEPYAHTLAGNLSYGNKKLLEIARALATQPSFLLLDEPAAGVSEGEIHRIEQVIRSLQELGIASLLIEHHVEMVTALSQRVAVLDFGEKIAEGNPAEVQANPRVVEAYLGSAEEVEYSA